MRVVFLSPVATLGGAERMLLNVLHSLGRCSPETRLAVVALGDGPLIEAARAAGAEVEVVAMPKRLMALGESRSSASRLGQAANLLGQLARGTPALMSYVRQLGRAVDRFEPDIVHSNGLKTHALSAWLRLRRASLVWHVHDFLGLRPVSRWLLPAARRRAKGIVAISRAVADDVQRLLPSVPTRVVLNAIDLEAFSPASGDGAWLDGLAALDPAAEGTVRVGLVATYARWKGHEVFLRAARRVLDDSRCARVRFYLVGGPVYHTRAQFTHDELRRVAAELGISHAVGFVPFQEHTADVYRALDVVVHASTQPEPFGLTVAEAMACGRATIVSQAGGAAELFCDGDDAVGVRPRDEAGLAEAIARLSAAPAERQRLGRRAAEGARLRFDRARLGPELLDFYGQVALRPQASLST